MARQATPRHKAKTTPAKAEPKPAARKGVITFNPDKQSGRMREVCGSMNDEFNQRLLGAVCGCLRYRDQTDADDREGIQVAAVAAMIGFAPRDEIEGMIAGQAVAINAAVLECLSRAMVPEQPIPAREMNLSQANKLARSFATLVETLSRYRGKGMQTVRVEHVTVEAGANAVIGSVDAGGKGQKIIEGQSHAQIAHAPVTPMRRQDTARDALPVASNAKRSMQDARRNKSRRA